MNIKTNDPTIISSVPPSTPANAQDEVNINSGLGALQTIIASTNAMLNAAEKSLQEALAASLRVKVHHSDSSTTPTAPVGPVSPPPGNDDATGTEDDVKAVSLICQIDNLIRNFDGKDPKALAAAVSALQAQLKTLTITSVDVKKMVDLIKSVSGIPTPAVWKKFWADSNLGLKIGAWIGGDGLNVDFSTLKDKAGFEMDLMQIVINIAQNPASVQGASLDDLFWGHNSRAVTETVEAYFMQKNNGDWTAAKKDISAFLETLPPVSQACPNYSTFRTALYLATFLPTCPVDPKIIFSDAFGFADAWSKFRTATPLVDSNHIMW